MSSTERRELSITSSISRETILQEWRGKRASSNKDFLKEFVISKYTLKEGQKEVLETESKWFKKKKKKERKNAILEHEEERITKREEIWVHTIDYLSHEFYKSYLRIETTIIIPSGV